MTKSASTRPQHMKPSWRKGKTSGWTAFDREKRHKKVGQPEGRSENFPSISTSMDQIQNIFGSTNRRIVLEKPFASVLRGSINIPASGTRDMGKKTLQVGNSNMSEYVNEINAITDVAMAYDILKKQHPWAEQSLIEDVLAGVNNDVVKASALLKMMVTSENNYEDSTVTVTKELKSNCKESLLHKNKSSVDRARDLTELSCLLEGVKLDNKEFKDENASVEILIHDDLHNDAGPNFSKYIPIEPEWEEDDVYLVHRKDARRMMRSASQHSKAASDAYLRGDHLSAQLYSRKAHEEWIIADRLNAKAAQEILAIRNSKNDEWTLDLHGLHASEAVQALQAHLQKIESYIPAKQFLSANGVNVTSESVLSAPPEFTSYSTAEKLSNRIPVLGSRPTSLQVITGKGNHSRGEAAIPAAVRSFLIENGYRYDEARPGVIEVKPKFR